MRGRLQLVLILPDGSKSLIPAEWTDYQTLQGPPPNPALVGSLDDFCDFAASSMLSSAAPPRCRYHQVETRRAMPQLPLNFTDIPIPETCLWEGFDDEQKRIVIETLARLMTKATRADNPQESTYD